MKLRVRFTTMTDTQILITGASRYMYEHSIPGDNVELLLTLRNLAAALF
jgi:hypothetical protein